MEFSLELHEKLKGLILVNMCAQQVFMHLRDSKQFFYTLICYKKLNAEIYKNKIVPSLLAALLFFFQGAEVPAQNIRLLIRTAVLLNRCI